MTTSLWISLKSWQYSHKLSQTVTMSCHNSLLYKPQFSNSIPRASQFSSRPVEIGFGLVLYYTGKVLGQWLVGITRTLMSAVPKRQLIVITYWAYGPESFLCDGCVVFSAWWVLGWLTVWWLCCFQCLVDTGLADCVMTVLFSVPGGYWVGWQCDDCVVFSAWWVPGWMTVWWLCCFQCLVDTGLADCVMTVLCSVTGGCRVGWLCDGCVVFSAWWILGWLTVWWLCCFQCLVDTGLADCVMTVLFSVPGGYWVGWLCDDCVVFSDWWVLGWLTVWWLCCFQCLVGAGLADCVMAVLCSVTGRCRVGWLCDDCVVFSDWWVPSWLTVWWLCCFQCLLGAGHCRVGWLCDGCVVFSDWWVPGWLTVWWLCCVQWLVGAGLADCVMAVLFSVTGECQVGSLCVTSVVFNVGWPYLMVVLFSVPGGCRVGRLWKACREAEFVPVCGPHCYR